jgi:hypothetical protein
MHKRNAYFIRNLETDTHFDTSPSFLTLLLYSTSLLCSYNYHYNTPISTIQVPTVYTTTTTTTTAAAATAAAATPQILPLTLILYY